MLFLFLIRRLYLEIHFDISIIFGSPVIGPKAGTKFTECKT